MSITPSSDPYLHSSSLPWWGNRFSGTSGGVKLSLVTDQRSEKPSFWEPRPVDPPPSSAATAPASASFSPLTPTSTAVASAASPPANTYSIESVRRALVLKDQRQHKQLGNNTSVDGDSTPSENSATPSYARRQWQHQSTPGTPIGSGTNEYPCWQSYTDYRRRGRGRGRGRGAWPPVREQADGGHLGPNLDVHAQEFVPGQFRPSARASAETDGGDLNKYVRAGAGSETTLGSSRVSVFGSRTHSPSSAEEDREVRSTERERREAERQWHLQTSWDDDENKARDECKGSAPDVADTAEGRRVDGGELGGAWVGGEVSELLAVPAPAAIEPPVPAATSVELQVPAPASLELPVPAPTSPAPPVPYSTVPTKRTQPDSQTLPFGILLGRAKMIQEGAHVAYPKDVMPPFVHTNASTKTHRLCYDRDFLLQFQSVCTGLPLAVPSIPHFWHTILATHESRPALVRTKDKSVQASFADDHAHGRPLKHLLDERRTVDVGVETKYPGTSSTDRDPDATPKIVDIVHNRLVPDDRDRPRAPGALRSRLSSSFWSEPTCGATPSGDGNAATFDYEVQEAQRERLEARVEYLAAEVKVLRLALARIRNLIG